MTLYKSNSMCNFTPTDQFCSCMIPTSSTWVRGPCIVVLFQQCSGMACVRFLAKCCVLMGQVMTPKWTESMLNLVQVDYYNQCATSLLCWSKYSFCSVHTCVIKLISDWTYELHEDSRCHFLFFHLLWRLAAPPHIGQPLLTARQEYTPRI